MKLFVLSFFLQLSFICTAQLNNETIQYSITEDESEGVVITNLNKGDWRQLRTLSAAEWFRLLDSEMTDWAANLALYQLHKLKGWRFRQQIPDRKTWVEEQQKTDIAMWKNTLKAIAYPTLQEFLAALADMHLEFEFRKPWKDGIHTVFPTELAVQPLIEKYGKQSLCLGLVNALDRETTDWNANLLLYAITKRGALTIFGVFSRDNWGLRRADLRMWKEYFLVNEKAGKEEEIEDPLIEVKIPAAGGEGKIVSTKLNDQVAYINASIVRAYLHNYILINYNTRDQKEILQLLDHSKADTVSLDRYSWCMMSILSDEIPLGHVVIADAANRKPLPFVYWTHERTPTRIVRVFYALGKKSILRVLEFSSSFNHFIFPEPE